jgi:dihydrodipicolinate synthase/N-acetylneuraminate lyase
MDVAEEIMKVPNTVAVKWGSSNIANYLAGFKFFVPRAAVVNNGPLSVYGHQLGVKAWVSHVPNFYPQHSWAVHDLMTAGRYEDAERVLDDFNDEYNSIRGMISSQTAGEGVFVKPFMKEMGRPSGPSRLPSRDEAVTQEVRERIRGLMERAPSIVESARV